MRGKTWTMAIAVVLICFGRTQPILANVLINGDFEAGNTGFASAYTYAPGAIYPARTYDVVSNPYNSHVGAASFPDHTSGTGLMLAVNGGPNSNDVVWGESVAVANDTTYEFSGWATSWGGGPNFGMMDPNPAAFRISINGVDLGPAIQLSGKNGEWVEFGSVWNSTTAGTAQIELRLNTTQGFGNDPAFDDFRFAAAPEPGTLALLGLGLAGLAATRQRTR